jgi:hypothetical protein
MGIDKMLRSCGFEFNFERTETEAPAEMWINEGAGFGVRLEWFKLRR